MVQGNKESENKFNSYLRQLDTRLKHVGSNNLIWTS